MSHAKCTSLCQIQRLRGAMKCIGKGKQAWALTLHEAPWRKG